MNPEKGIAMLEVALFLTVLLPLLVVCVLVFEIGRLNSGLRESVSTALSEIQMSGMSTVKRKDPAVEVLGSVTRKLRAELVAYDTAAIVGTLNYALTDVGKVENVEFISADCSDFYPELCRNGGALRAPLEEKMKTYLSEHIISLAVRDVNPVTGSQGVVTLPGRLVGVFVRIHTKGAIWRLLGVENAASYIDVVSPRQEVTF